MEAFLNSLDVALNETRLWVVPVYQRRYEWETNADKQIPKLWEDLRDTADEYLDGRLTHPHYIGAIIFSEPSIQPPGTVRKRYLVDGQQRITTFELILAALREVALEHGIPRIQDAANSYLFNEERKGMADPKKERYKLWPSARDRPLYQNIVDNSLVDIRKHAQIYFHKNGNLNKKEAPKLLRAYWFFHEAINTLINDRKESDGTTAEKVLDALLLGFLNSFQIVMIHLDEKDDAQEIFASLNGMAEPLSPFDLIRNDVFHRARKAEEDDETLFNERWKKLETPFWDKPVRQGRSKRTRADHLIAHAVVAETAREINAGKIATEYQRYAREKHFSTIGEEVDVLLRHAQTYFEMEELSNSVTNRLTRVLLDWDLSTFHPVVLWINAQEIEARDKESLFRLLENYVVRREICGLTTKNYNKVAINVLNSLNKNTADAAAFAEDLAALTGDASRMPTDDEILEAARTRAIYNIPRARLRYILQQLEHISHTRFDETVELHTSNLTIEHVMPQKWAEHWPLPNGTTAPYESTLQAILNGHVLNDETKLYIDARQQCIDTLGNLTLVTKSLNPSLGNDPWVAKRARLAKTLLALNRDIAEMDHWTEEEIYARGYKLGQLLNKLWPAKP